MYPKTLITLLLTFSLVGVGCEPALRGMPEESNGTGQSFSSGHTSSSRDIYKQWAIQVDNTDPYFLKYKFLSDERADADCLKVVNGDTAGGDLLSTLIVNRDVRDALPLSVYTQDYVEKLERRLVGYTHRTYQADLYAFSACHLGEGVDVITGYLWPQGEDPLRKEGKFAGMMQVDFYVRSGLFILTPTSVAGLVNEPDKNPNRADPYLTIQLLDNTATGAEVYPCDAALRGRDILWTCFQGLYHVDDQVAGGRMKSWLIKTDGTILETKEWVDGLEEEPTQ